MIETKKDLTEKVQRGTELLDEEFPNWHLAIDLDELSMASDCNCIIGQLLGDFLLFSQAFDLSLAEASNFGFDGVMEELFVLHDIWTDVITERLSAQDGP